MRLLLQTSAIAALGLATSAHAVTIDNDIAAGTLGHLSANVTEAGETRSVNVTVDGAISGLTTTEVVFDYYTYVDLGLGGVRLSSYATSGATLSGDDTVTSSGQFSAAAGNLINWTAETGIAGGSNLMVNTFTFTAETGTLGDIQLFQYLDEDVLGVSDDVFFTRGSAGAGDLELYTIDADEIVGISHGGAYSTAQGLLNASFDGWAADTYNGMKPMIGAGTQSVALDGMIEASLSGAGTTNVPGIGTTLGTADIVSSLAWSVDPNATTATIITTLGGVPDITFIPPVEPPVAAVPLPAGLPLALFGLASLAALARRRA